MAEGLTYIKIHAQSPNEQSEVSSQKSGNRQMAES
jgi:hypothetical protein